MGRVSQRFQRFIAPLTVSQGCSNPGLELANAFGVNKHSGTRNLKEFEQELVTPKEFANFSPGFIPWDKIYLHVLTPKELANAFRSEFRDVLVQLKVSFGRGGPGIIYEHPVALDLLPIVRPRVKVKGFAYFFK